MSMHIRYFTVRGRGEFPLDMLRYDHCWPRAFEDAEKMSPYYGPITPEAKADLSMRNVDLARHTPLKHGEVASAARWQSFGWIVIREAEGF